MRDDAPPLSSLLLACACAGLAPAVQAEIYKWVDERGIVNYSSAPPPANRPAEVLPPDNPAVTVLPAPPRLPEADSDARRLRERVERLESAVGQQARERYAEVEARALADEARHRQCELDRIVDCEREWWDVHYPAVVVGVRPPHQRSLHFKSGQARRHEDKRAFRDARVPRER